MNRKLYYFDNNATTRIAPEVVEAMLPYLTEKWGNPSSAYSFGNELHKAIDTAREQVAALIHADPREIVFTSCGTESNNAAINSAIRLNPKKRHIITTAVEHSATIKYCKFLETQGYEVTWLPVERDGTIDIHLLVEAIRPDTAIVSLMWANNETGVLFPVEEAAAICQSHHVPFHTDAVQVAGKLNIDAHSLGADFLSLSAHKLHAPKGIGMLYVKRRTPFQPLVIGGQQERGRRGGTENVPYMVAFGRAAELALENVHDENTRVRRMRDRVEEASLKNIPATTRNGSRQQRLPNTSNLAFAGVEAEAILLMLNQLDICASSGSACTTGSIEPSHVLTAMGLPPDLARSSVRFSFGKYNTDEEVDYLLQQLPGIIQRLRAESPVSAAA
ncbi:MAG TPA: cysteine desulfurase NifS [Verrucomicrobiae bacterium]